MRQIVQLDPRGTIASTLAQLVTLALTPPNDSATAPATPLPAG